MRHKYVLCTASAKVTGNLGLAIASPARDHAQTLVESSRRRDAYLPGSTPAIHSPQTWIQGFKDHVDMGTCYPLHTQCGLLGRMLTHSSARSTVFHNMDEVWQPGPPVSHVNMRLICAAPRKRHCAHKGHFPHFLPRTA